MKKWKLLVAVCCLVAVTLQPVYGWNHVGHMLVAKLAYADLTPAQRASVLAVLKKHPHYESSLAKGRPGNVDEGEWAFMRAATWPDYVRPPKGFTGDVETHPVYKFHRGSWHYINYPYKARDAVPATLPAPLPAKTDILRQITANIEIVKGTTTTDDGRATGVSDAENRAVRLCWLVHLVGDLHQPLHSAALVDSERFPDGDQGGNLLAIRANQASEPVRLHSFWDGLLGVDSSYDTLTTLTNALSQRPELAPNSLTELSAHATAKEWAQESFEHAISAAYLKGELPIALWEDFSEGRILSLDVPVLPAGTEKNARQVADRRVVLAGKRLAQLVKENAP